MNNLKHLRTTIQKNKKLKIDEIAQQSDISVKSIYRIENIENFESSIYIKYLNFLRENKVDVNQVLEEIFKK